MRFESAGEIYFVVGMILLCLVMSVFATYFFIRQYKKEMAEKEKREAEKAANSVETAAAE